jgi:hypothetical protein
MENERKVRDPSAFSSGYPPAFNIYILFQVCFDLVRTEGVSITIDGESFAMLYRKIKAIFEYLRGFLYLPYLPVLWFNEKISLLQPHIALLDVKRVHGCMYRHGTIQRIKSCKLR